MIRHLLFLYFLLAEFIVGSIGFLNIHPDTNDIRNNITKRLKLEAHSSNIGNNYNSFYLDSNYHHYYHPSAGLRKHRLPTKNPGTQTAHAKKGNPREATLPFLKVDGKKGTPRESHLLSTRGV